MLTHDELAPLIAAIVSARVTSAGEPLDRTPAEGRRLVLYALWRIERRDRDGLRVLVEAARAEV